MKKLILLCSTAVAVLPTAAFAQSTGTQEFEKEKIVVTGSRTQEVGGVQAPDTSKAKAVLTQEYIGRQNPGQTILDTINAVPGVSFQNNDAYGSSGGTLTIRGFSSDRVSLTFDGIQLNDSGNYAIFSNQMIDPELIEQVNVNLGTTDVDSPTASAVGGTVNLRTRLPATKFGARVVGSLGEFDFRRIFAVVDTGEVGPWGTRAYFSVSNAKNDNPFNNYGKVDKQQYNAKIYQPIGSNGDFVALSGHYNQNRNNFFGSVTLRTDAAAPAVPGSFPTDSDEREYNILYPCTTPVAVFETRAQISAPGYVDPDAPNGCGNEFDRRYNPSNTGNVRVQSRFTLMDNLVLTFDPSYQYVKANGGGTATAREYGFDINPASVSGTSRSNCATAAPNPNIVCIPGYFAGNPYFGSVDLNGDGDILDTVRVLAPSQTHTDRFGIIAGLRWTINDNHQARITYTLDYAKHRQTGEVGLLQVDGEPFDVFPINDGLHLDNGFLAEKRDRKSKAILNQVSAEYRGEFIDDRLTVNAGVRLPFFYRSLDMHCFTDAPTNFVDCSGGNPAIDAIIQANNPYVVELDPVTGEPTGRVISGWSPPQKRTFKYNEVLPNIGFVFDITPRISAFANYAKGLSVPSTDNLYNDFFFPEGTNAADPDPETTNSFDGGLRYRSSTIQAQVGLWKTFFKNRTAQAFDPELNASVFRNLGTVDKWGVDGSVAWSPIKQFTGYLFGSLNKSKIKDNIQIGGNSSFDCDTAPLSTPAERATAARNCAFTEGKSESGSPKYTYGASFLASLGDFDFGATAKRTGPRYIFDNNQPIFSGDVDVESGIVQIFPSKTPAYWLVNLDARYNLRHLVGLEKSYFALNVYNLFDETYVGGFTAGLNQTVSSAGVYGTAPFAQIGAPRTVSGTLSIEF